MANDNEFKLTYYTGVMLAQGGVLKIEPDRALFVPGAIERAVGASDTVILFEKVKMVEVTGTITESLIIRTQEKPHRFVGGDPYKIRDRINAALQEYYQHRPHAPAVPPAAPAAAVKEENPAAAPLKAEESGKCPSCSAAVRPEFHFCPFCKAFLNKSCPRCFLGVEPDWKYCPSCGGGL